MSALIKPFELLKIKAAKDLLIFDATGTPDARQKYESKHLEGAFFVDVNTQLADIKQNAADGGRHPLPTLSKFSSTLGILGITPSSHIVVYDDKNGSNAAARFWWMLKAIGHNNVHVLDGGMEAAVSAGFPTNAKVDQSEKKEPYKIRHADWLFQQADIQEIDKVSGDEDYLIIDVRDAFRYDGINEPIDLIAGHIPGALNIPFSSNMDSTGKFLSATELKSKYDDALGGRTSDKVIVHCGSGITACHTLMAIAEAGIEMPKLYVGSWSEWSRNDRPMIIKKDES
ncbi:MAG: sulfurtransferase [Chryseolinea sp.]